MCLSELSRRKSHGLQKSPVEITDVIESDIHSDVGYFVFRFDQAKLRLSDAEDVDVLHRGILEAFLENVGDVIRAQSEGVRHDLQGDLLRVVSRQPVIDPVCLGLFDRSCGVGVVFPGIAS